MRSETEPEARLGGLAKGRRRISRGGKRRIEVLSDRVPSLLEAASALRARVGRERRWTDP